MFKISTFLSKQKINLGLCAGLDNPIRPLDGGFMKMYKSIFTAMGCVLTTSLAAGLILGLTSCSDVEFKGILAGSYSTNASEYFPQGFSEINFKQVDSFKNEVSLQLNVTQMGSDISGIDTKAIQITHGGVKIDKFNLVKTSSKKDNIIDIAFVIDVTGTMSAFIEDAKGRIIKFIDASMKDGIRTRICISTFGDYTVKKCDRFFDNNPNDTSTLAQTKELISEISSLRAFKGQGQDPGWPDFDENPMGAIVDVSKAPFRQDAQKFVILVTDAGFLYSPQNQGTIGTKAPSMPALAQAIKDSQITIFGITPMMSGYTSPLNGFPGIVEQSSGEHYLFQSVINGEVNLNQILNRIIDRVQTSFVVSYFVDDYKTIDPTMPVEFDDISINIKDTPAQTTKVNDIKISATFPNGRPEFIQEWVIASNKVDPLSLEVWVNLRKLDPQEYLIDHGTLRIKVPPALSANIFVSYKFDDLSKNIRLKPVFLNRILNESDLEITLNGIPARDGDLLFERTLEQDLSVMILPEALKDNYYKIEENFGVYLEVE